MTTEVFVHTLSEEKYLQYLIKISEEKKIVYNLLFSDPTMKSNQEALAILCEYHSSLHKMEKILNEIEESFIPEKQEFYMLDEQALTFVLLLSSIVTAKESMPLYNVSICLH